MTKVVANPEPVPDPAQAKRPGGPGKPKTIGKGGSLPPVAKITGAGQGRIRTRPRYSGK